MYLGVPFHANNAITHHITNTIPLIHILESKLSSGLNSYTMPSNLNGYQLSFMKSQPTLVPYDPIPIVPSYFWRSRAYVALPSHFRNRKALCREIFDIVHYDLCTTDKFHLIDYDACICCSCGDRISHYHQYFCCT